MSVPGLRRLASQEQSETDVLTTSHDLVVRGVDTVKELRTRSAANLVSLEKANAATGRRLVRQVPGLKRVQGWIDTAKSLPPAVTY